MANQAIVEHFSRVANVVSQVLEYLQSFTVVSWPSRKVADDMIPLFFDHA